MSGTLTTSTSLADHDRGGLVAYRVALCHPELITHLFSVCVPYTSPSKEFRPLEYYIEKGILPNFAYQLKLAGGQLKGLVSREEVRQFLNAIYGGQGPNNEVGFNIQHGCLLENLPILRPTRLVSEPVMNYYVDQYTRNGVEVTSEWLGLSAGTFILTRAQPIGTE